MPAGQQFPQAGGSTGRGPRRQLGRRPSIVSSGGNASSNQVSVIGPSIPGRCCFAQLTAVRPRTVLCRRGVEHQIPYHRRRPLAGGSFTQQCRTCRIPPRREPERPPGPILIALNHGPSVRTSIQRCVTGSGLRTNVEPVGFDRWRIFPPRQPRRTCLQGLPIRIPQTRDRGR